jgi:hypothetical protein
MLSQGLMEEPTSYGDYLYLAAKWIRGLARQTGRAGFVSLPEAADDPTLLQVIWSHFQKDFIAW